MNFIIKIDPTRDLDNASNDTLIFYYDTRFLKDWLMMYMICVFFARNRIYMSPSNIFE